MQTVTIIIPVKNEEGGLRLLKKEYSDSQLKDLYEIDFIFVIDSETDDHSRNIANYFGGKIVEQTETRGKGAAIQQGITTWKNNLTSYVIFLDADGSYSFDSVEKILIELNEGVDVVSGSRFLKGKGNLHEMSRLHFIGNKALSSIASLRNRKKISDLCTGLWGFQRDAIVNIEFKSKGFDLEAEIFGLCRKNRLIHNEAIVDWNQRKAGVSKLRSIRDGLIILARIVLT